MTREELIEKFIYEYQQYGMLPSIAKEKINQITELSVIDGKIELLKEIGLPNHCSGDEERIKQLENTRTELLTKLNLEG